MTTEASACQAPRTLAPPIRGLWTSMDTGNDCKTRWSTENLEISFFQHRLVLFLCFHLVRCVELLLIRVGWIRIKVNSWKPHAGALSTVTHQWSPWGGLNTAQCFSYGANDQAQCEQAWRQIILEICLWDWRDKTCKPDDARWVRIPNFACGKFFIIWKSIIILTCCWRCSEISGEKKSTSNVFATICDFEQGWHRSKNVSRKCYRKGWEWTVYTSEWLCQKIDCKTDL